MLGGSVAQRAVITGKLLHSEDDQQQTDQLRGENHRRLRQSLTKDDQAEADGHDHLDDVQYGSRQH